ncbi:glycerophosphodiester phosphodiesterase family protein [Streptomyces sp. NPDC060194]|uniref:glycerophosphodiester phosphodiesterase family protein n=1 Tax=Streptomyces sp. NPDC060194 TaxID=3347069 RepID=UPI0036656140
MISSPRDPRDRHPFLDHPAPLAFAHRGGAGDGPADGVPGAGLLENTVPAFRNAVDQGYRYLETDVHVTADGRLVAFHDPTLDRMTDHRGTIARLPWSAVAKARVGGREPIPLFEELLEEFPEARWNIDVKAEAALLPLIDLIGRTDSWDRVCVGSFAEHRAARARRLGGPRLATSYGAAAVLALRLRSYGPPVPLRGSGVCVQVPETHGGIRVVDERFVRAAHARGLQVHVWTVNDPAGMRRLLDLGVDGIMTDRTTALRSVLTDRGAWA